MVKKDCHAVSRRAILKSAAGLGLFGVNASLLSVNTWADTNSVDMQLGWLASNGVIGEVVAIREGFYKEQGIKLDITPGGPGVDGVHDGRLGFH